MAIRNAQLLPHGHIQCTFETFLLFDISGFCHCCRLARTSAEGVAQQLYAAANASSSPLWASDILGYSLLVGSKNLVIPTSSSQNRAAPKSSQLWECTRTPAPGANDRVGRLQPLAPFPAFRNPTTFVKEEHVYYIMDAHGTMIVPSLSDAPTLKYCGWKKSCTSWDRSNPCK